MLCKLKQGFKNNKSKNCIMYLLLWLSDLTSRTHVWHCYSHAQIFFNKAFHVNKVKPELLKFHVQFSSVQSLSHVWLLATPWITARQASLSITNSRTALTHVHQVGKVIQPSHPLSSPSPTTFSLSQHQGFFQLVHSKGDQSWVNNVNSKEIHMSSGIKHL